MSEEACNLPDPNAPIDIQMMVIAREGAVLAKPLKDLGR